MNETPIQKPIQVCAAIILQGEQVLVCGRKPGSAYEGFMEFPGGKVEPGETHEQCLIREIREELGTEIRVGVQVEDLTHDYGNKVVQVYFYLAERIENAPAPESREGQAVKWVLQTQLDGEPMLPADRPLAERLTKIAKKSADHTIKSDFMPLSGQTIEKRKAP